jgi:hypothetical protein
LETKKVVFALAFAIGCTQECVNCQRQWELIPKLSAPAPHVRPDKKK